MLLAAVLLVIVTTVLIPYLPPVAEAFRATPLDPGEWLVVALIAVAPALLAEVVKTVRHTRWVA
jgi:magnesium-transporting ATPase (P-type)